MSAEPEAVLLSRRSRRLASAALALGLAAGPCVLAAPPAEALPEIRMTDRNRVPACVTPDRLQRFLAEGNGSLPAQYGGIANYYKQHGERLRIRWDYAFFQMIIETNFLKFATATRRGDVSPRQNNFAGIGTTGGGVPGDSFPDISTGVLAQMQHLVAYSGERVANPVATRTREKQDEIVQKSLALRRPPTFQDLAGRWAADRRYGRSIESIADRFRAAHCGGREPDPVPAVAEGTVARASVARPDERRRTPPDKRASQTEPGASAEAAAAGPQARRAEVPARAAENAKVATLEPRAAAVAAQPQAQAPPQRPAKGASHCAVLTASYGGQRNVLIKAKADGETQYTALQVLDGQEQKLARSFIKTHAAGGETIGEFPTRDAALARAFELCPTAKAGR